MKLQIDRLRRICIVNREKTSFPGHSANLTELNEPRHEKTGFFAYAKTKTQISFAVTAKLISAFVFAT